MVERRALEEELDCEGLVVFEDESITLHCFSYEKDSRNILLQCISIKRKHVFEKCGSEIDIKNKNPIGAMELHQVMGESLAHTMDVQERENAKRKKRVEELEVFISPRLLVVETLSIVHSIEESLVHAHKKDKVNWLLSGIKLFVEECIKTIMDLIYEAFEILENTQNMGNRIRTLKDLLTSNLNRDQEFSVNHLSTFVKKVESLIKETWRRNGLPFGPKNRQV